MTRARVQQYQRYFADADRVLILLHNDPDPDALASGLALRNLLRRTKTTAIIGAMQGVTRPENLRMANMLDIHVEPITPASFQRVRAHRDRRRAAALFRRPAASAPTSSSITIPSSPATARCSRTSAPTTARPRTILTEHLRAVDVNISERTATAMLYAIKSDTLFFARHTNRVDLEAFTFLYPLADAALIRKMEGAEITLERLDYVTRASQGGIMREQVFSAFIGEAPREDFIPYTADFFLQLEDVKWTIIAGVVGDDAHRQRAQPRLLAQRRRVREALVRRHRQRRRPPRDGQGGRADGRASRQKFGDLEGPAITARIAEMAEQFLHEAGGQKKKEPVAR